MVVGFVQRQIIHVDMDAFFAAVEQRDNPELRGKPVIIGGKSMRGVVSTCSYEARKFGVRSAMPIAQAIRLCSHGIFMGGNHEKYQQVSKRIMDILQRFTPLVEPVSIDEAFLDVTGSVNLFGSPENIGWEIKKIINKEVCLTASVGIAPNKYLAKLASDWKKPDGFMVIKQEEAFSVISPLPISKIWGIGDKTAEKLRALGVATIKDIANCSDDWLLLHLGKNGPILRRLALGLDDRPVKPHEEAKSIGHEITFSKDINDREYLTRKLLALVEAVGSRLRKSHKKGKTVSIKLKRDNFSTISRSFTLSEGVDDDGIIYKTILKLFEEAFDAKQLYRLLGVSVSNFLDDNENQQLSLFSEENTKKDSLNNAIDDLRSKFGKEIITRARLIDGTKQNK